MKTKFYYLSTIALFALAFSFFMISCEKDDMRGRPDTVSGPPTKSETVIFETGVDSYDPCGDPLEVTLWGGQHIDVGTVTVANDEDYLYLKYKTTGDWYLEEIHLYIMDEEPSLRLPPGHAPIKLEKLSDPEPVQEVTIKVAFDELNLDTDFDLVCEEDIILWLQAHAVVYESENGEPNYDDDGKLLDEETAYGGDIVPPPGAWYGNIMYLVQCCDDGNGGGTGDCQEETAWGGNSEGGGAAWWFYYDASVGGVQTIWAGQHTDAGTVEVVDGTVYITLTGGWELQWVNEPVKIKGYDEIPGKRPPAGQFTGEGTYKGDEFVVDIGEYEYYAIHLDVMLCEAPPCVDEITLYGVTGTNGNGGLWAIEIIDNSFDNEQLLIEYNLSGDTYSGNGLAFDEENNRLYFAVGSGSSGWSLYFYDFGGTDQAENIHLAATGLPGQIYGATWGAGKYWYIKNGSNDMSVVEFDADGKNGTHSFFELNFVPGKSFNFGDIALDAETGIIYASTSFSGSNVEFFKYDLNKEAGERYNLITDDGDARGLQLGFAGDGNLYGVSTFGQTQTGAKAREWFLVNTGAGTVESLGLGQNPYNDLSTGPSVICD